MRDADFPHFNEISRVMTISSSFSAAAILLKALASQIVFPRKTVRLVICGDSDRYIDGQLY